jgi:glycerol kinase
VAEPPAGRAARTAQAAARLQAEPVTCIAVTAQRSSLIAVDVQGRPLHPAILWQDSRCTALAQAMAEHDALVYRKTGLKISPVFSAIKMAWLRRERPGLCGQPRTSCWACRTGCCSA